MKKALIEFFTLPMLVLLAGDSLFLIPGCEVYGLLVIAGVVAWCFYDEHRAGVAAHKRDMKRIEDTLKSIRAKK